MISTRVLVLLVILLIISILMTVYVVSPETFADGSSANPTLFSCSNSDCSAKWVKVASVKMDREKTIVMDITPYLTEGVSPATIQQQYNVRMNLSANDAEKKNDLNLSVQPTNSSSDAVYKIVAQFSTINGNSAKLYLLRLSNLNEIKDARIVIVGDMADIYIQINTKLFKNVKIVAKVAPDAPAGSTSVDMFYTAGSFTAIADPPSSTNNVNAIVIENMEEILGRRFIAQVKANTDNISNVQKEIAVMNETLKSLKNVSDVDKVLFSANLAESKKRDMNINSNMSFYNDNYIQMGNGVTGLDASSGKIQYATLGGAPSVAIYGAGAAAGERTLNLFDKVAVNKELSAEKLSSKNQICMNDGTNSVCADFTKWSQLFGGSVPAATTGTTSTTTTSGTTSGTTSTTSGTTTDTTTSPTA